MSGSAENGGSDEAAASASANASATAGGGPSGGGSADNPTVPPLAPALPTETLRSRNGTEIPVTIVPRTVGNKTKRSWVWQVYREFKPEINQKNVFCTLCQHLLFWKASSGTRGMSEHYRKKHPTKYKELMKGHSTVAQGRATITKAIGTYLLTLTSWNLAVHWDFTCILSFIAPVA